MMCGHLMHHLSRKEDEKHFLTFYFELQKCFHKKVNPGYTQKNLYVDKSDFIVPAAV